MDLARIEHLAKQEPKTLVQRTVKLQEEVGELAQEILIHDNASGQQYKTHSADGIRGECVDVTIVALSIFFAHGGNASELERIILEKCTKWEKHQQ